MKSFSEIVNESIDAHNISSLKNNIDYKRLSIKSNNFWAYIPLHFKSNIWLASAQIGKVAVKPIDWYAFNRAQQKVFYVGNNNNSKWVVVLHKNKMSFTIYNNSGSIVPNIEGIDVYQYIIKPNLSLL